MPQNKFVGHHYLAVKNASVKLPFDFVFNQTTRGSVETKFKCRHVGSHRLFNGQILEIKSDVFKENGLIGMRLYFNAEGLLFGLVSYYKPALYRALARKLAATAVTIAAPEANKQTFQAANIIIELECGEHEVDVRYFDENYLSKMKTFAGSL